MTTLSILTCRNDNKFVEKKKRRYLKIEKYVYL